MTVGRPSSYNKDIAAELLSEIASTNQGLATICKQKDYYPDPKTVYRWLLDVEEFRQNYTRAKEDQSQVLEDEILAIADETHLGEITTDKGNGFVEVQRKDMIEHRKLRIESRKWLLTKLKPKKYGDKLDLTHTTSPIEALNEAQLRERLAGLVNDTQPTDRSDPNS